MGKQWARFLLPIATAPLAISERNAFLAVTDKRVKPLQESRISISGYLQKTSLSLLPIRLGVGIA
jgi:hypothetical protein